MDYKNIFSERLCLLEQRENISHSALGRQLGLTQQAVSLLALGKRVPSFEVLIDLADFFNVSLDYLTGRVDCPQGGFIEAKEQVNEE